MSERKSDNIALPEFITSNEIEFIGKGIECKVYLIVKAKLVCKIYACHAEAEYNYRLQRIAFRAGIAPEPMGFEYNYYFSRYADSIANLKKKGTTEIIRCNFNRYTNNSFRKFIDKVEEVFGGRWSDSHNGNVGVVKIEGERKFYVIDFGVAGFQSTKIGSQLSIKLQVYY